MIIGYELSSCSWVDTFLLLSLVQVQLDFMGPETFCVRAILDVIKSNLPVLSVTSGLHFAVKPLFTFMKASLDCSTPVFVETKVLKMWIV